MKKLFLILGFIAAILAVILAVTPLSKLAYIPSVAALIFGVLSLITSKDNKQYKRSIQLIFLMTIIALTLTTYKALFTEAEVGNTEQLEEKEDQLEQESLDELDNIELEELDSE
ncbi:FUSC family protein [uncultured Psychroserpens sp.]|uniref:FUSC family protein n=1 Tax=uncultured Psychroserpens sp. TaxID=255436 RepID=UPI0026184DF0|nr:FUSC family protein [uncultured Psychroserpens sp.]